jgi:DNA-binding response OmpR family regulator
MAEHANVSAKILIVDDEPNVLRMVSYTLQAEGYEVVTAQNGAEAISKAQTESPDLILLDVMLPDMSGVEVCAEIRKRPETIDLPVIMLSALAQVSDKIKGLEAGADEYITKPITPGELIARIKALLGRFRQVRRTQPKHPGKVLAFIGAKGGVGTTTVVLNIATALVMQEKKVIAAEIRSSYGTFAAQLNLDQPKGLASLLEYDPVKINEHVVSLHLIGLPSGLKILVGPQSASEYRRIEPELVDTIIQVIASMVDYVILDLPCYYSDANQAMIRRCDLAALVIEPETTALASGIAAVDQMRSCGVYGNRLGVIVVNRAQTAISIKLDQMRTALGQEVIGVIPTAADALTASQRIGMPLLLSQPNSDASKAYVEITKKISASTGWVR